MLLIGYHTYPKYSDRQEYVNSEDPDQTLQNAASNKSLHCFPLMQLSFVYT